MIPFTFFKTRNKGLRFTSKNKSMDIVPATAHLSEQECQNIIMYCQKIGLEYGEIDILRSDDDGKIYIIDVNNTPWWPPNKLGDIDRNIALNMMWNSLILGFFPDKVGTYYIPDEHLDDFINNKNPEKNNRNRKIINQEQFRFIAKDYDFPYQKMRDDFFANYKKKPLPVPSSKPQDGKKKWVKKHNNNGNKKSNNSQQTPQVLQTPQRNSELIAPQKKVEQVKKEQPKQEQPKQEQPKQQKKFHNKSK
jgi:hypothetical protein